MITSATPSQVSVALAPVAPATFNADSQQTVFKPLAPVVKSDAIGTGDKERHIDSPLTREMAASGFTREGAGSLVTYNKDGRLSTSKRPANVNDHTQLSFNGEHRDAKEMHDRLGGELSGENDTTANGDDAKMQRADSQKQAVSEEREVQKQDEIRVLAARDREVRAHEQAHAAIGGAFAGAPKYQFERGPDGVNYAVGGEVPIDVSPAATPEATISKMQAVRRAALAPAEPSPQDRRVAQEAIAAEARARQEMVQEQRAQSQQAVSGDESSKDKTQSTSDAGPSAVSGAPNTENENEGVAHLEPVDKQHKIGSRDGREPIMRSISVVA